MCGFPHGYVSTWCLGKVKTECMCACSVEFKYMDRKESLHTFEMYVYVYIYAVELLSGPRLGVFNSY